jgi:hypothetical protein
MGRLGVTYFFQCPGEYEGVSLAALVGLVNVLGLDSEAVGVSIGFLMSREGVGPLMYIFFIATIGSYLANLSNAVTLLYGKLWGN